MLRFAADENFNNDIVRGLRRRKPDLDIVRVQEAGLSGAADPARVGAGEFGPVSEAVWSFSVSGLSVVQSWLSYRKKSGAGGTSSPLDAIRPERWTAAMTQELLELLWVLDATVVLYPQLRTVVESTVQSACFHASELPTPTDEEKRPPLDEGTESRQLQLDV